VGVDSFAYALQTAKAKKGNEERREERGEWQPLVTETLARDPKHKP
jgi:hypothetical protein